MRSIPGVKALHERCLVLLFCFMLVSNSTADLAKNIRIFKDILYWIWATYHTVDLPQSDTWTKNASGPTDTSVSYEVIPPNEDNTTEAIVSKTFLVGEDTPVWIARAGNVYEKLPKGIVRRAVDHLSKRMALGRESNIGNDQRNSGDYVAKSLSVAMTHWNRYKDSMTAPDPTDETSTDDDGTSFVEKWKLAKLGEAAIREAGRKRRSEPSGSKITTVYPTILVVMDYQKLMKSFMRKDTEIAKKYIMYALTFWRSVNLRLKTLKNPSVSLRIGGIVIGDDTRPPDIENFPYMDESLKYYSTPLEPMYAYWRYTMTKDKDFPTNSYDIVVHMADYEKDSFIDLWQKYRRGRSIPSVNICSPQSFWNVIQIYEYEAFRGIESAVHEMRVVLGDKGDAIMDPSNNEWDYWAELDDSSRNSISDALKNAKCLAEPKEFHQPGKPIPAKEIPLPGQLIGIRDQCLVHSSKIKSWNPDVTSLDPPICRDLTCGRSYLWLPMRMPEALDGTMCARIGIEPSICAVGECVPAKSTWEN